MRGGVWVKACSAAYVLKRLTKPLLHALWAYFCRVLAELDQRQTLEEMPVPSECPPFCLWCRARWTRFQHTMGTPLPDHTSCPITIYTQTLLLIVKTYTNEEVI